MLKMLITIIVIALFNTRLPKRTQFVIACIVLQIFF